ncbi:MAG: ornithine carbamoyltransferase [Planctomycetota bacterium]
MTAMAQTGGVGAPIAIDARARFPQDLLGMTDLMPEQVAEVLDLAAEHKKDRSQFTGSLAGKSVVMLFEKPSLRTRLSFEIGLGQLGAQVVFYDLGGKKLGERESVKDYAKNIERWSDLVVARVFSNAVISEFAEHSSAPVVNALCDLEHPCQALADLLTLREAFGTLKGLKVAYVGDGNNVCHSLMLAAALTGVHLTVVTPRGFQPSYAVISDAMKRAERTGATVRVSEDMSAIRGHAAVYTDAWLSMGQTHQQAIRDGVFEHLRVDEDVMALASEGLDTPARFMHCLPAHRGEEVVDAVIDGPGSLVYEQAENRLHAQVGLVLKLLGLR